MPRDIYQHTTVVRPAHATRRRAGLPCIAGGSTRSPAPASSSPWRATPRPVLADRHCEGRGYIAVCGGRGRPREGGYCAARQQHNDTPHGRSAARSICETDASGRTGRGAVCLLARGRGPCDADSRRERSFRARSSSAHSHLCSFLLSPSLCLPLSMSFFSMSCSTPLALLFAPLSVRDLAAAPRRCPYRRCISCRYRG